MKWIDRILGDYTVRYDSMGNGYMKANKSRKRSLTRRIIKNKVKAARKRVKGAYLRGSLHNQLVNAELDSVWSRQHFRQLLNPNRDTQPWTWTHVPRVMHDKYFRWGFRKYLDDDVKDVVIDFKSPIPKFYNKK